MIINKLSSLPIHHHNQVLVMCDHVPADMPAAATYCWCLVSSERKSVLCRRAHYLSPIVRSWLSIYACLQKADCDNVLLRPNSIISAKYFHQSHLSSSILLFLTNDYDHWQGGGCQCTQMMYSISEWGHWKTFLNLWSERTVLVKWIIKHLVSVW